jgi:hypothetical protein
VKKIVAANTSLQSSSCTEDNCSSYATVYCIFSGFSAQSPATNDSAYLKHFTYLELLAESQELVQVGPKSPEQAIAF